LWLGEAVAQILAILDEADVRWLNRGREESFSSLFLVQLIKQTEIITSIVFASKMEKLMKAQGFWKSEEFSKRETRSVIATLTTRSSLSKSP